MYSPQSGGTSFLTLEDQTVPKPVPTAANDMETTDGVLVRNLPSIEQTEETGRT